jgi:ArsR family transcriptional regulator, arsenate/arsenite/antimonite-responsive transcriptional repressor
MDCSNKHKIIPQRLNELGHETRLQVYRHLIQAGETPVGEIQKALEIPASTLSHHLNRLIQVGLIEQERKGTLLYCSAVCKNLREVICYLQANCCK